MLKTHETIHGQACLVMKRSAPALAIFDGGIYQVCILWFVRRGEKQSRIRRGILEIHIEISAVHLCFQNMSLPVVCTRQWLFTSPMSALTRIGAVGTHIRNRQSLRQQSCRSF